MEKDTVSADSDNDNGRSATVIPAPRPGEEEPAAEQAAAGGDARETDDGTDAAATEPAEASGTDAQEPASGRRSRWAWLRDPLVLALVLVLVGTALLVRASQVRGSAAAQNRALTDVERTEMVIGDVSNALGKVFSYSYTNTAVTEQAARDELAGRAYDQYQTLFAQVKQRAGAQRLTLTTRVVRAGVVRMTEDTAHLLVFLDQTIRRRDKPDGMAAAAQLAVTARLSDGHWRIIDIQAR